jgi:hypothetical protein
LEDGTEPVDVTGLSTAPTTPARVADQPPPAALRPVEVDILPAQSSFQTPERPPAHPLAELSPILLSTTAKPHTQDLLSATPAKPHTQNLLSATPARPQTQDLLSATPAKPDTQDLEAKLRLESRIIELQGKNKSGASARRNLQSHLAAAEEAREQDKDTICQMQQRIHDLEENEKLYHERFSQLLATPPLIHVSLIIT